MARNNDGPKDISYRLTREYKRTEAQGERAGNTQVLRTGCWVVNGKATKPSIERREVYNDAASGQERSGKAKGLSLADVKFIVENLGQVMIDLGALPDDVTELLGRVATGIAPAAATDADPWAK